MKTNRSGFSMTYVLAISSLNNSLFLAKDPLYGVSKEAFDSCYPKLNDDFKNKTPFIFGTAGEIFNEMDFVKNKAAYFFEQSLNKISVLPNKEFLSKEQIIETYYNKQWENYLKQQK